MRPRTTRGTAPGVRFATWTVMVIVFLVLSWLVATLPGVTWLVAGAAGGLVVGLGGASWACLRAWWRG
ncbi:MAG: hypothetical protein MSC31_10085 [Solirubrobacteraceae bacterium MAG38_C4-C5]|nr:hypothetical protein [Candidatus Siliceabacter maunaloa]